MVVVAVLMSFRTSISNSERMYLRVLISSIEVKYFSGIYFPLLLSCSDLMYLQV